MHTASTLWPVCLVISSLSGLVGCHIPTNPRMKSDGDIVAERLKIVYGMRQHRVN